MRTIIGNFQAEFDRQAFKRSNLLEKLKDSELFSSRGQFPSTCELLIRSAARIEQTFGGLTTRLWDDPFEWTLPEELSDKNKVAKYFAEVRDLREIGLRTIVSDSELAKEIPAPDELKTIHELLLKTVVESASLYERALLSYERREIG